MSATDGMATEVDDHARQVEALDALDRVTPLIDAHEKRMARLIAGMGGVMDDMGGCGMDGASAAAMDDAGAQMAIMKSELEAYQADHEGHTSLEQCRKAAADHARQVRDRVARMQGHREHMMSGMTCGGMTMMGR